MTTAQEIFTQVWNHFVVDGGAYSVDSKGCCYRGPNGAKCAVGVLLRDDEYSPEIEGSSVGALPSKGALPERLLPHLELLRQLQLCHDGAGDTTGVPRRLQRFAEKNDFGVVAP